MNDIVDIVKALGVVLSVVLVLLILWYTSIFIALTITGVIIVTTLFIGFKENRG